MERTNGKEKIVKAGLLAVLLLFAAPAFVFPLVGSGALDPAEKAQAQRAFASWAESHGGAVSASPTKDFKTGWYEAVVRDETGTPAYSLCYDADTELVIAEPLMDESR